MRRSDKGWPIASARPWVDPEAMAASDSAPKPGLDPDLMAYARGLLAAPEPRERTWPVLGAAGFLAAASLVFAVAMIAAPPLHTDHAVRNAVE